VFLLYLSYPQEVLPLGGILLVMKTCKVCGASLEGYKPSTIYCSKKCRLIDNTYLTARRCAFCDNPLNCNQKKFCSVPCKTQFERKTNAKRMDEIRKDLAHNLAKSLLISDDVIRIKSSNFLDKTIEKRFGTLQDFYQYMQPYGLVHFTSR